MKRQAIGKKRNENEGPGNGEARAVEEGIRLEGGIEEEKGVGTVMEEKGRRSDEKRGRRGEENGKNSKK